MANHPSAERRNRQRIKRTQRNRTVKTAFRTLIKDVREAIGTGDPQASTTALRKAESALAGAAGKGVLHRATASRKVSRLAKAINKITTPAAKG